MIAGVRQFKLINALGREYDCTRPDALLHAPDGLGWGTEATVNRLGMTYIGINEKEIHQSPSGEMVFRTYEEYGRFLSFCQQGGLVLCYKPIDTWYYCEALISIQKSEIQWENNHLICPVQFTLLSYWYEKVVAQTAENVESENKKQYSYTYSYQYGSGVLNAFDITCDLPSYFRLTIFGEATNPSWRVVQNGSIVKSGKINATIGSSQKLVINTDPKNTEIALYTLSNTRINNLYGYSDFSTERIFALPQGESQVQVLTEDEQPPKVMIEVLKHV